MIRTHEARLTKWQRWFLIGVVGVCLLMVGRPVFGAKPRYVIIMISGGAGFNHIDAASLYQYGATGLQIYERFEIREAMTTHVAGQEPYDPALAGQSFDYILDNPTIAAAPLSISAWLKGGSPAQVTIAQKGGAIWLMAEGPGSAEGPYTESAAAATALSTGIKTLPGFVGVDPLGDPVRHSLEMTLHDCKAAGLVTTVPLCDDTPAGFIAHNSSKNNHAEIAREMILKSRLHVLMGCGHPLYDDNGKRLTGFTADRNSDGVNDSFHTDCVGGDDILADMLDDGLVETQVEMNAPLNSRRWHFTDNKDEIADMAVSGLILPPRLLYLARAATTLQQARAAAGDLNGDGRVDALDIQWEVPFQAPANNNVATLTQMTQVALDVLAKHIYGFVLVVDAGAVDWASRANQSARMIEEQIAFNRAVEAVVAWVTKKDVWEDTLIIVTSDHETGYLTGPNSGPKPSGPVWNPLVNNGRGKMPGMEWHGQQPTNAVVPFFAQGDGAYLFRRWPPFPSYVDNTEVGRIIMQDLFWHGCYVKCSVCCDDPGDDDDDDDDDDETCDGFRTQTQGGWGSTPSGNNPGAYLAAHFPTCFGNAITIGCGGGGFTATFTSAAAIEAFLPAGGTAAALTQNHVDPTTTEAGVLAGQVLALSISVGFDECLDDFSTCDRYTLAQLVVVDLDSPCYGMTVADVLAEGNKLLGGCASSHTLSEINGCIDAINNNFVDGTQDNGFLGLP